MSTWAESRPEPPRRPRDERHNAAIGQAVSRRAHRERPGGPLIVVGVDTSDAAGHALAYAAGAARRMHATVLVAHISTLGNTAYPTGLAPMGVDVTTELAAEKITAARELAIEILRDLPMPWSFIVRSGDAAVELARLAEDNGADSLVVGRSSTWLHRLTGSTAARLLRRARCPVTVVP